MRLVEARANIVQACDNYRPDPVGTRMVLIRAEDEDSGYDRQPDLGWSAIAREGLEIYQVNGDHTTFMKPPYVDKVADCLTEAIRKPGA